MRSRDGIAPHARRRAARAAAALIGVLLAWAPAAAGGARVIVRDPNTGLPVLDPDGRYVPVAWDAAGPVPYAIDRGPLGTLSNQQAAVLVQEAFDTLEAVETASISFQMVEVLPVDVNEKNWALFFAQAGDGRSPVIFDADGRILDQLLGLTARHDIEGASRLEKTTGSRLEEASILINGACFDGDADPGRSPCELTHDELRALILHEAGHFANLDHSDLNRRFAADGVVSNNAVIPTMFAVQTEDDATLVSLGLDDALALSRLYPEPGFLSSGGSVEGTVLDPNGVPIDGANVVVRNVADPYRLAASAVSGDEGLAGRYRFVGLPPGNYVIEVGPIASAFNGRTSVGQATRADGAVVRLPGPAEFLDDGESASGQTDDPDARRILRVHAGTSLTGQDVILNDLASILNDQSGAGNESPATATPLPDGGGTVADRIEAGDVDYYALFVPAGWRLQVDVDAADRGLDSSLLPITGLFDPGGTMIDQNALVPIPDPGSGESGEDPVTGQTLADPAFEFVAPAAGSYAVAVSSVGDSDFDGAGGTTAGSYYVRVLLLPPALAPERRLTGGGGRATDALGTIVLVGSIVTELGADANSPLGEILARAPGLSPTPDEDGDGVGDLQDPCPGSGDVDQDGVCDDLDNCGGIANAVQADGNGNGLGDPCDAPSIVLTIPPDGTFDAALAASVQIQFSEPMDQTSFGDPNTSTVVRLIDADAGGALVPARRVLSRDGRFVTLDPDGGLLPGTDYTILVDATLQDASGTALAAPGAASFRTTGVTEPPAVPVGEIGDTVEGTTSEGAAQGDLHGVSVASDGDVNRDGFTDILIGAPSAMNDAAVASGEVVLILGAPGFLTDDTVTPTRIRFVGSEAGQEVGRDVAFAGDINGDGLDDILIGAPGTGPTTPGTGAAYLVFGRKVWSTVSSPVQLSSIASPACETGGGPCGLILGGEQPGDRAGQSVSFAGDFNHDGRLDLLVGAPLGDPLDASSELRTDAGIVYLVLGSDALESPGTIGLSSVGADPNLPGVVFLGENAGDEAGTSISDWRDRLTDGVDDLLIGSPGADVLDPNSQRLIDAGIVHTILGDPNTPLLGRVDLRSVALGTLGAVPGFVFLGEDEEAHLGQSVSGHGDVTGDGEFDIFMGAPGMSRPGRLLTGGGILIPSSLAEDNERGPIKRRTSGTGCTGTPTTVGGVVQGTAGGPQGTAPSARLQAGEVLRQIGPSTTHVVTDLEAVIFTGEETGDEAGAALAVAGDASGDGVGDMMIGAPGADVAPPGMPVLADAGRVYLVLGQTVRPPGHVPLEEVAVATPGLAFEGQAAFERLGESVAGAGDVDGSTTTELLLGAPGAAAAPPGTGTVYIAVPAVFSEATDLTITGGAMATLEWARAMGAVRHEVYRGPLAALLLARLVETSSAVCLTPGDSADADADLDGRPDLVETSVPPPGEASWFLVSGANALGEGPLGFSPVGELHRNDCPCPCP